MTSCSFKINDKCTGKVIGKKGINIKKISNEYSIYINISKEKDENDMREICLYHFNSLETLSKAKAEILFLINENNFIKNIINFNKEEEENCPICLEKLDKNKNYCTTKCGHKFHLSCLNYSLRNNDTCPICRGELSELNNTKKLSQEKINEIINSTLSYGYGNNLFDGINYFFTGYSNSRNYICDFLLGPLLFALNSAKNYLEN